MKVTPVEPSLVGFLLRLGLDSLLSVTLIGPFGRLFALWLWSLKSTVLCGRALRTSILKLVAALGARVFPNGPRWNGMASLRVVHVALGECQASGGGGT